MKCNNLDCKIYDNDVMNIKMFFENLGSINQMIHQFGYQEILNKDNEEYYEYLKNLCLKYEIDYCLYGIDHHLLKEDFYYMCGELDDLFVEILNEKFGLENDMNE